MSDFHCAESLAYLTAATHGQNDEAEVLRTQFAEDDAPLPVVAPDAILLQPPVPIAQQESNWPLLTRSKGFWESAISAKGGAGGGGKAATSSALAAQDDDAADEAGWGDDAELVLDDEG